MKRMLSAFVLSGFTAASVLTLRACIRNARASRLPGNRGEVDTFLEKRINEAGNVQLPPDKKGLMYNAANRSYASGIIKKDLGIATERTEENIASEIFAHVFAADILLPFKLLAGRLPPKLDIYSRVARADIDENEKRLGFFRVVDNVFEDEK